MMTELAIVAYGIGAFLLGLLLARSFYNGQIPGEHHNGNTMVKVLIALQRSGLSIDQARMAIGFMQNRGILFRESIKPKDVTRPLNHGSVGWSKSD